MARYNITVLAVVLGANAVAAAATLKGTARNGTTGKPAAGNQVILLSLAGGATEIGRGKTDASGRFRFVVAGSPGPLLVRVVHQGVDYGALAPAGGNPFVVQVYDAAGKLDGVIAAEHKQSLQTEGDTLQVIEEIVVRNASHPPRTLMNDRPFEIQLPPEAEVIAGKVQIGGAQPLTRKPAPGGQKGQYYFPFPLRPGYTRFGVAYRMPYRGEAVMEPKILYPLERVVVVLPKSMKFEAENRGMFQPGPEKTSANVQVALAVNPRQSLAFRVSGTGTLVAAKGGQQQARGSQAARTGGSMGTPAESRNSVRSVRWFFLGGLALVLTAGVAGLLAHKRKQPHRLAARGGSATRVFIAPGRLQR
ncbi:MAG: hypothetical protein Q8N47_06525 [Bryobacterales bacterium]|nr:hypothetical protein [Bryobacterales bacterium]